MSRAQKFTGRILVSLVLLASVLFLLVSLQKSRAGVNDAPDEAWSDETTKMPSRRSAGFCLSKKVCPSDQFSFYIKSGAINSIAPVICIQNKLVLGSKLNNAGRGINVVIMNSTTGQVTKTDHFDMHGGAVELLIQLLNGIQTGSAVLMASFDDPSTKLNEEARKLIAELGSSFVQSLDFRDSWGFVGTKGSKVKSPFEKHIKNNGESNKYDSWPECVDLEGCIPKLLE